MIENWYRKSKSQQNHLVEERGRRRLKVFYTAHKMFTTLFPENAWVVALSPSFKSLVCTLRHNSLKQYMFVMRDKFCVKNVKECKKCSKNYPEAGGLSPSPFLFFQSNLDTFKARYVCLSVCLSVTQGHIPPTFRKPLMKIENSRPLEKNPHL